MRLFLLTAVELLPLTLAAFAQQQSQADVLLVERELTELNYVVGEVDGAFDDGTASAIRLYQIDWCLPETGKISDELTARLKREHPDTRPRMQKAENAECELQNLKPEARETFTVEGDCSTGQLLGKGRVVWRFFRQGSWKEEVYEGDYQASRSHGSGKYLDASGNLYEGDWKDGEMHGQGSITYHDGSRYEGEFKAGEIHGHGVFLITHGNRYEGEFQLGELHGYGKLTFVGGSSYEGNWEYGKPNGKGVYVDIGGDRYSGEWRSGCYKNDEKLIWVATTEQACRSD